MVESRWLRSIGTGLVTIAAAGLVASTTLGAGDRPWAPRGCTGPPASLAVAAIRPTARTLAEVRLEPWFRLDPRLDRHGALRAQRLVVGLSGRAATPAGELARESFAACPFGRIVLVGADDGSVSRLDAFDARDGCRWPLATEQTVIRRATVDPAGATVFETRVDRDSRADLGVWRRPLDGSGPAVRILAPLHADDRFGRTFSTTFSWDSAGSRLAVQSCGEVACRTRILDPATGRVLTVVDPRLGTMIALDGDRLISYGACRGLPCPIVRTIATAGSDAVLVPEAGPAIVAATPDGLRLVHEDTNGTARRLRSMALDGSAPVDVGPLPDGLRLVVPGVGGEGPAVPSGWVLLAPDGRLSADVAPSALRLRQIPDGTTVPFEEATR